MSTQTLETTRSRTVRITPKSKKIINTEIAALIEEMPTHVEHSLWVEVIFGSPSKKCAGLGICEMIAATLTNCIIRRPCPSTSALLFLQDSYLYLLTPTNSLLPQLSDRQFSRNYFYMEEDYYLPRAAAAYFNLPQVGIKRGRYTLTKNSKYYLTRFPIA